MSADDVSGQFGSGITAYFIFLRWVVLFNLVSGVFWFLFVVLPAAIHFDYSETEYDFYLRDFIFAKVGNYVYYDQLSRRLVIL